MLKRLSLFITVIVLLAVGISVSVTLSEAQAVNRAASRSYLRSAARYISEEWEAREDISGICGRMIRIFEEKNFSLRATIVDFDGAVLFDNSLGSDQSIEVHRNRPEIHRIIMGEVEAEAIRFSHTLGIEMMYLAVPAKYHDAIIRIAVPLEFSRNIGEILTRKVLFIVVLVLVVLVFSAFWMTRRITMPLTELSHAVSDMGRGAYSKRVPQFSVDYPEIQILTRSFNVMAASLEQHHRELMERNAHLSAIINSMMEPLIVVGSERSVSFLNAEAKQVFGRDIDPATASYPLVLLTHEKTVDTLVDQAISSRDSTKRNLQLYTARGKRYYQTNAAPIEEDGEIKGVVLTFHDTTAEQEASRLRSEFVANVTHELKTPLTSIRGFVDTLRNTPVENREHRERFLSIIDVEAERLERLINDILALSEIESGNNERSLENFDLNALIDEVAVLLDDYAGDHKVSLIVESGDEALPVTASRNRLKEVLINLIDNAVKYNQEGGKVRIASSKLDNGMVRIKVSDTGQGIPPEYLDRIFERFFRVDKSRSRDLGGTGLGLSIVKHIAQLYGGQATVESKVGLGTCFNIDLKI